MANRCQYCKGALVVIYNNIKLCALHYKKFHLKDEKKTPIRLVPKTTLESSLKRKYTELISRPYTPEEFDQIVTNFRIDVEIIKMQNPIYMNID